MGFPSPREAETFRVKLYRYKKAQDRLLSALELLETPQSLSFKVEKTPPQLPGLENEEVVVTIKLVELRRHRRTYSFITVSEGVEGTAGTEGVDIPNPESTPGEPE